MRELDPTPRFTRTEINRGSSFGPAELEEARRACRRQLRRIASPQFVEREADDLLATAMFEYSRHLAAGDQIDNPVGWIVHCASQRTKNLFEAQGRRPLLLTGELDEHVDEAQRPAEEELVAREDCARLRAALTQLPSPERELVRLVHFVPMSVRAAARVLGWNPSRAQRAHLRVKHQLRRFGGPFRFCGA